MIRHSFEGTIVLTFLDIMVYALHYYDENHNTVWERWTLLIQTMQIYKKWKMETDEEQIPPYSRWKLIIQLLLC